MPRRLPRLPWLALPLAYCLYFFGLSAAGLLGPDEPRYASIGRAMASTGDWVTPRLWSVPWFEKPALLYWMTGAAFRLGLGPDLAPRLPVALLSVAFLILFWWILWREFGCFTSWMATLILATSAGWCLYSESGVTDIPLSATYAAAMLLSMPWIAKRETRLLPVAACLFGLAVLAKGPVALVLAAPLALRWRHLLDWFRPRVALAFLLVAAPWYLMCYQQNGQAFLNEFFWKHNIGRFTSAALQHSQPFWFYLPALIVLLLPWSPLLPLAFKASPSDDSRRRFLLLAAVWPILFFSLAVNKLPGYILPAFPAIAALIAIGLSQARKAAGWLAVCALSTVAFAIAAPLVDIGGISRGAHPVFQLIWLAPVPVALAAWWLDRTGRRLAAVAVVAMGATAGIVYLKIEVGRKQFTRALWNRVESRASQTCVARLERSWRYGLNYYSVVPLPDCAAEERPLQLDQTGSLPPDIGNNTHLKVDQH
jgi:4-amino-4-deoxy-L-arabinose transferase-like glycosyltransferase